MASDPDKKLDLDKDADTFWNDYAKLSDGLTVPLGSVAPLIDAVRLLIRDWDTINEEERKLWSNQLVAVYNHAAAGVGLNPSDRETPWNGNDLKILLVALGSQIVLKKYKAASGMLDAGPTPPTP